MPYKRPFLSALFWTLLHWSTLGFFVATVVALILHRDLRTAYLAAGALAAMGLTWLFAFVKRNKARCPLCKGTPYLNTGAGTHDSSVRLFPLNHGITAMLSTIFRLRFRCMYCGTPYDLLNPTHHKRGSDRTRRSSRNRRQRKDFRG